MTETFNLVELITAVAGKVDQPPSTETDLYCTILPLEKKSPYISNVELVPLATTLTGLIEVTTGAFTEAATVTVSEVEEQSEAVTAEMDLQTRMSNVLGLPAVTDTRI